jgi:hypothetical protein
VLKIETDGSGAIHFLGDFSYTAHFDGKQYDLKNSRNDTVVLNSSTLARWECAYRRGDQVAKRQMGAFR